MSTENASVFLVDDDEAVRDSLTMVLNAAGLHVEAFESAESFLEHFEPDRAGCLILDVNMSGMSGLELQHRLAEWHITTPIVFLSAHGNIPMTVKAVKAGAVDFLPKPCQARELLARVQDALQQDAEARQAAARKAATLERFERLTAREREIMAAVVTGRSSKEIARDLGLSYRTVEIHRARVMQKMEAGSLPELVAKAVVCGLLELPV